MAKAKGVVVLAEEIATSFPKPGMNVDANGIFSNGYDPVAYFTMHKAIKGNPLDQKQFQGCDLALRISSRQSRF